MSESQKVTIEMQRAHDAKVLAYVRRKSKLRDIVDKERRCLKCEHAFLSQGGDRLCYNCKQSNASEKWATWGD